ncbi:MAG TPA: CHASE4 domain-containing protein [Phycisphaerae bacterium]|nr:CHASE4 domain-containing protein [Phycisphaerae bacterium]HRY67580.1 CHASE4 domain-containing protein [Phycisphaerae bacterium]HSA24967.1 CHASE4 domain-containing protein [Phycisphaerae bacterium]
MSLRWKVASLLTVVYALFVVTTDLVQRAIIMPSFERLENEAAITDINRAKDAIRTELSHLSLFLGDWAAWDDTRDFVSGQDNHYQAKNLMPSTFITNRLNLLWIGDLSGRKVWSGVYEVPSMKEVRLAEFAAERLDSGSPLLGHRDPGSLVTGLMITEHGPLLVASRPVVSSNNEGPIRGTMVMGRFLDVKLTQSLAIQTQVAFTARPVQENTLLPTEQEALAQCSRKRAPTLQIKDNQRLDVYTTFPDLRGQPALLLKAEIPRAITSRGRIAMGFAAVSHVLAGAIIVLLVWITFQRLVVKPVTALTDYALRTGQGAEGPKKPPLTSKDEIGTLAREFGTMVARLDERNQQLLQMQKMEAVGQLASGLAHDFNNLLTVILGCAARLRRTNPTAADLSEAVNTLEEAARQGQTMTQSLLTFAHRMPIEKHPIDLRAAIQGASQLFRHVLPASVRLSISAEGNGPLWVNGNATHLQQVLLNLAINARDAMPDGGELAITVTGAKPGGEAAADTTERPERGWARVTVADTGTGIPPEIRQQIFDPFFTTKPRGHGTGLGLAIVHGIIEDHNGQVEVESEVGAGSSFKIFLPLIESGSFPSSDTELQAPPAGQGEVLLLAEDNRHVRELASSALRSFGYQVIHVAEGSSVLSRYREHANEVRLCILDIDLPGRTGTDCLRALRGAGIRTPAILITGNPNADLDDDLVENGILLYKPFSMADLGRQVHRMLKRDRESKE